MTSRPHVQPLAAFAALDALACLFRTEVPWIALHAPPLERVSGSLVLLAALTVLARPGDVRRLVGLACVQVIDVAVLSPVVPNHWLLLGFAHVAVLASAASLARRGRLADAGAWRGLAAPLRWGTAAFYLFTGFWKLNHAFLDPTRSCGVQFGQHLADRLGGGSPIAAAATPLIVGTLLLELGGPWLLLLRRTRVAAALAFGAFHAVLGLDAAQNLQNFSCVMFALLVGSLAPTEASALVEPARLDRLGRAWAAAWATALVALACVTWLRPASLDAVHARVQAHGFAFLHAPLVLWGLARLTRERAAGGDISAAPLAPALAFAALVVLNGACPWLGLKNRSSWQMYGNLRLEAAASNHLLVPRSLDLLGLQAETVEVRDVTDEELAGDVAPGERITWYMLRWHVARAPDVHLRYERGGVWHELPGAPDDPALDAPPWLLRKVSWFAPVGEGVAARCVW